MKNKNRTILDTDEKTSLFSAAKALESSSAFSLAKALENSSVFSSAKALESSSAFSLAKALENSSVFSAAKALESSSAFSLVKSLENSSVFSAAKALESSSAFSLAKALENSSVFSAAKALESSSAFSLSKALENSSVFSAAKALESSSAFSLAKALENSSIFSATKALESSSFLSAVKALNDPSRFSSFSHLADILSSKNIGPLTLSEAYLVVTESYVETSAESNDARLEIVSDQVEERVKNAPSGVLSKEFYLSMILTLILFWLSQLSTMESEERLLNKIEQFQTNISQQLSEYESQVIDETFYIVERGVNLRTNPNTKSEILVVLHPNQKVRLIERKSKWIKVEYFNYTENTFISGWVFKKYLKRIK